MSLAARVGWLVVGALVVGFATAAVAILQAILDLTRDAPEAASSAVPRILGSLSVAALVVAGAAVVAVAVVARGSRALRDLADLARQVEEGDLSARVAPAGAPEVRTLGVRMNAMLDELQHEIAARHASEETTKRFLADASHELRTPLATIRGHAELFRRGAADRPDDLAKAMYRIESESARMTGLVEGLLRLSRADEGRLTRSPLDLAEVARSAVDDFLVRHPDSVVDARLSPAVLAGDRAALEQVVANLLENTAQHAPGSPVRVTTLPGRLLVEDGGPGVPAANRERILDRLARGTGGGNGLGLAIVNTIAHRHDGSVTIDDSPLGGALVRVTLGGATAPPAARLEP